MGLEIKIGAVGNTFKLTELTALETEAVLNVHGALGVVRKLLFGVFVEAQVIGVDPQVDIPSEAVVNPILVPLFVGSGLDEEFHLHLFELTGAEDEVSRSDLVTETLTNLANTERRLHTCCLQHVGEVHKDALCRFGTQIVHTCFFSDGT